jgi:hypothetical protein
MVGGGHQSMQVDFGGISLFVSLVYYAESTVCWFVVKEKYCWMAADSADKSKRTGRLVPTSSISTEWTTH